MASMTARDLITQSLKRIGVISGIETPSADLAQDSLTRLNDLIESWATESLSPWTETVVGGMTLDTVFELPPGYHRALRDWLAIELAPELGRPIDPVLLQTATEAKGILQRSNFQPRVLEMPTGLSGPLGQGGLYNWRTDDYE